mgnify:CR=1 FL=1
MNMDTIEAVFNFCKQKCGIDISADTIFFDDLGMDGLDAEQFITEFADHFKVDISGFIPQNYYTSEKDLLNFPKRILNHYFSRNKIRTFNTRHLVNVIEAGKWFDP